MQRHEEQVYLAVAKDIIRHGDIKSQERTGVGTSATFGRQLNFDIAGHKLPVVTTRKVNPMHPIIEMLWFIAGDTNVRFLLNHGINIWNSWIKEETKEFDESGRLIAGSIGEGAYGAQWRKWEDVRIAQSEDEVEKLVNLDYTLEGYVANGAVFRKVYDQLADAIELIKGSPDSRRIIVNAWNPGKLDTQVLPCCHFNYQFYTAHMRHEELLGMLETTYHQKRVTVDSDFYKDVLPLIQAKTYPQMWVDCTLEWALSIANKYILPTRSLKLLLRCRSQDYLVGTVYNVLQYAALAHMVAQVTNTWATELIWQAGDTHIYQDQKEIFLERQCDKRPFDNPNGIRLSINPNVNHIDGFRVEDFEVSPFDHGEFIKYPVAV